MGVFNYFFNVCPDGEDLVLKKHKIRQLQI